MFSFLSPELLKDQQRKTLIVQRINNKNPCNLSPKYGNLPPPYPILHYDQNLASFWTMHVKLFLVPVTVLRSLMTAVWLVMTAELTVRVVEGAEPNLPG